MNAKLKKCLDAEELQGPLMLLLLNYGYITNIDDPNSLTEKAKDKKIGSYEMDFQLYERIKALWPKEWTSSYAACNDQYTKMMKAYPEAKGTMPDWELAVKYYLQKATYTGELKYFWFKDKDSRLMKTLELMKSKPTTKEFKER